MSLVAVVDDEPLICMLVEECLGDVGTEVFSVTSAEAGAALLASRYFDVALIDVLLCDTSGILLAEIAVKQNTPVLLITGHAETALRLRRFGFPHLLKPFSMSELAKATERVAADRHRSVQGLRDGLARMHADLAGLDVENAIAGRLAALAVKPPPGPGFNSHH